VQAEVLLAVEFFELTLQVSQGVFEPRDPPVFDGPWRVRVLAISSVSSATALVTTA